LIPVAAADAHSLCLRGGLRPHCIPLARLPLLPPLMMFSLGTRMMMRFLLIRLSSCLGGYLAHVRILMMVMEDAGGRMRDRSLFCLCAARVSLRHVPLSDDAQCTRYCFSRRIFTVFDTVSHSLVVRLRFIFLASRSCSSLFTLILATLVIDRCVPIISFVDHCALLMSLHASFNLTLHRTRTVAHAFARYTHWVSSAR